MTIIMCFDAQIVPHLARGTTLQMDSLSLLTCPHHSLSTSFFSGEARYSQPIFYFLCAVLQSGIFFPKKPPLSGEWSLETKIWVLGMHVATGMPLLKLLRGFIKDIGGEEGERAGGRERKDET